MIQCFCLVLLKGEIMDKIVNKNLKVDFHIHSALSSHKDGNKVSDNTISKISVLIDKLVANQLDMVSISDHDLFDYNLYGELKKKESDGTFKKVFPAVEFSVSFENETKTKNNIHIVCVFDDSNEEKLKKLNSFLINKDGSVAYDVDKKTFSEEKFLKILKNIGLDVVMIAHQKGSIEKKAEGNDVKTIGKWRLNEFIESEFFDSFEFKNPTNGIFNNLFKKKINDKYEIVRFITGSDCHVWSLYPQMDSDDKETDFRHTYLKCLPSFRGVAMALTDDSRISLNENSFSVDSRKIDFINIKNKDELKPIPLSRGINVIIGDNSIGKSLLLHKLTNYSELSDTKKRDGYNSYLASKKIEIQTTINKDDLYSFDYQGEIRNNFSNENPGFNNEFLLSKYPPDMISTSYIDYIKSELENLYSKLEIKFKFGDELKKLNTIQLITKDIKDKQLSAVKNSVNLTSIISEKNKIVSAIVTAVSKLSLLLEMNISRDEHTYIENVVVELNKMLNEYKKEHVNLQHKKTLITAINDGISAYTDHMKDYKSTLQNLQDTQNENIIALSNTISELIKLRNGISTYEFKINTKPIEVSKEQYGKYQFIKRFANNRTEIDSKYYKELISKVLVKDKSIDTQKITNEELKNLITNKTDEEKRKEALPLLKDRLDNIIIEEFKNVTVILDKDTPVTDTLSQGLNSTIYFDIVSNDKREGIYLVDQPEDDISQSGIRESIINDFKIMRGKRQVIIVTHNPQFVVNLDADNVICIEKDPLGDIIFKSGALEYSDSETNILKLVMDHLDGGLESIRKRWKRYEKNIDIS